MKNFKLTKELVLYVVFGALTTAVSFVSYYICNTMLGIHYLASNIVFESKGLSKKELLREFFAFILARLVSLGMEELGLWLLIGALHCDENLAKLIMQVVVVIANYVFSKLFIFKKNAVEE